MKSYCRRPFRETSFKRVPKFCAGLLKVSISKVSTVLGLRGVARVEGFGILGLGFRVWIWGALRIRRRV